MSNKLAKLADLRTAIRATDTDHDVELTALLVTASTIAERAAGLKTGSLRRQEDIVEYPRDTRGQNRFAYLDVRPIESITSIKQLYETSATLAFDSVTALVEFEAYTICQAIFGSIERRNAVWYLMPHALQVTYTGGYADPEDEDLPESALLPPEDLQEAVIQQAILMFNTRDMAGIENVSLANGGSYQAKTGMKIHPALEAAVLRYRRIML